MIKKLPPIHPGEILFEEFLKPLGMNPHQLAMALRVPPNRIAQIIEGRRAITAETALRLGRYFGVNPQFWLNLQSGYDLRVAARATPGADRSRRSAARGVAANPAFT